VRFGTSKGVEKTVAFFADISRGSLFEILSKKRIVGIFSLILYVGKGARIWKNIKNVGKILKCKT
jgi:hypothetical protein